jgi:hypothetical protein
MKSVTIIILIGEKYPGLSTTDMLHNIHKHKMYALSEDIIALDRYQNVPQHNQ